MTLEAMVESAAQAIGIAQLKEEQKRTVCSFVSGNDIFVSLPTGYGKSLLTLLLLEKMMIISPDNT